MAETVIPTIMDIAEANGYSGDADPKTVIEALLLLGDVVEDLCAGVAIRYRGSVATYADLPSTDLEPGDMYMVQQADVTHGIEAGDYVIWDGSEWNVQSSVIDISGAFLKLPNDYIDSLFA